MVSNLDFISAMQDAYNITPTLQADGDVRVIIETIDDTDIIAFRGTVPTDIQDWLRDISAWPTHSDEYPTLGYCHSGFLTGGIALYKKLKPLLLGRKFVLVGHSLGGALSVVVGALCIVEGLHPHQLVTCGAPSIGFSSLTNITKQISGDRIVDSNDPIPHLLAYYHDREQLTIGTERDNSIDSHFLDSYKSDWVTYSKVQK